MIRIDVPLPRGEAHYWRVACEFGAAGFTARELLKCTNGVARATVRFWITEMVARGHLKIIDRRDLQPRGQLVYAVTSAKAKPPEQIETVHGRIQRYLWTAIRQLPSFTIAELAAAASTDEVTIARHTAADYVRKLSAAGALIVMRETRNNSRNSGLWRLKKSFDTGPKAPRWVTAQFMIDGNTGAPLGEAEARVA